MRRFQISPSSRPLFMPQNSVETSCHLWTFFQDGCATSSGVKLTGTQGLPTAACAAEQGVAIMAYSTKRQTQDKLRPQQDRCVVTCRLRRNTFLPGEQILGTVKFEVSSQDQEYIDIEEVQDRKSSTVALLLYSSECSILCTSIMRGAEIMVCAAKCFFSGLFSLARSPPVQEVKRSYS